MAKLTQYLWIVVVTFFFGFFYAFGIGANDVANAFASTVASKSLTLKQAVIVAAIFEFAGALLLGSSVSDTIQNGIYDTELYLDQPDIVMLGMFTSIMTGTIMLGIATAFGLPVSTTHTIVGSIIGFSLAAKGFYSIHWEKVVTIIISWLISPIVAGIVGFIFFFLVKHLILTSENPFLRTYYTFPVVLTIFIGVDLFYVLYKGFNNTDFADQMSLHVVMPCAFGAGLVVGLIWIWPWGPYTKRKIERFMEEKEKAKGSKQLRQSSTDGATTDPEVPYSSDVDTHNVIKNGQDESEESPESEETPEREVIEPEEVEETETKTGFMSNFAKHTFDQDLEEQAKHENSRAAEIWDKTEKYDEKAEYMFTYVQVFTACLNSFAHGANDVSNSIAPLSTVLNIYETGVVNATAPVQKWILAYGGIGIVLGLLLYGYKVMKSLGYKICALSPSRGASAELAASLFVVTASFLSIPVSSTQSIVGGVTGVGLVSGRENVNFRFFGRICIGWITVFFAAILLGALLFALFAYTPSLNMPMNLNTTTDEL